MGLAIVFVPAPLFAAGLASPARFAFTGFFIGMPLIISTPLTVRRLSGKSEHSELLSFAPLFGFLLSASPFIFSGFLMFYAQIFHHRGFLGFNAGGYVFFALYGYPAFMLSFLLSYLILHARTLVKKSRVGLLSRDVQSGDKKTYGVKKHAKHE